MGVEISKHWSSYSHYSFWTKLFLNVPCDSHHKVTYRNFEISNSNLKKQIEI